MKTKSHTVVSYLESQQPKDVALLLSVTVTALIRRHKLPWKTKKTKIGYEIRDVWGKFILNHTDREVVEEIVRISKRILERWENEFPQDVVELNQTWDLIEKEDLEVETALHWEERNRRNNMVIR